MGLIKILVAFSLLGLFSIAVISYVVNFSSDNEAPVSVGSEVSGLDTNLRGGFDSFTTSSNSSSETLKKSNIKSGDENVEGGGQFKVLRSDMYDNTKKVFELGNSKLFGNDVSFTVFTTALGSILLTILSLYVWKTWKGGNPD